MKNPFVKTLSPTDKAVQTARELLTTIERVAEIGDMITVASLWNVLVNLADNQNHSLTKDDN
jgi:hypothetical protein